MQIYNSLTGNLELFTPINSKKVTIYVCGITPYDTTHLGHAFTYISFDALIKYLYKKYEVVYTQNVTDINDRDNDILKRAKEQNIPWTKLAEFWTTKFLNDMQALNWTTPTYYLKASENIPSMLNLIQKLITNDIGYQVNSSVYLDITKVADFGKLSKLSPEQMLIKAQDFDEDIKNTDKKNPLDITLWRASTADQSAHIPSFDSPFGKGRPGWHIECSAMSTSVLGDQIDIHGGGKDLIYPHHESEIAQSEGATQKIPFAKYWMHTGTVYYQGAKMSKSLGNLVMVSKLLEKYSANAIRWVLLSHHWQQDWEFKETELDAANNQLELVNNYLGDDSKDTNLINDFHTVMEDNLNTPKVLEMVINAIQKKSADTKSITLVLNTLGFII